MGGWRWVGGDAALTRHIYRSRLSRTRVVRERETACPDAAKWTPIESKRGNLCERKERARVVLSEPGIEDDTRSHRTYGMSPVAPDTVVVYKWVGQ